MRTIKTVLAILSVRDIVSALYESITKFAEVVKALGGTTG
jgi:hypothetical protein